MKKTLIICSTIISIVLVFTLLGTSVFAAINKSFGTNNVIRFVGSGQSMHFVLNGEITGTSIDGDPRLSKVWEYDVDDKNKSSDGEWVIEPSLTFTMDDDYEILPIKYNFAIHNIGNVGIKAFIIEDAVVNNNFIAEIVGKPDDDEMVYINVNDTQSVSLTITPRIKSTSQNIVYDCNFSIRFLPFGNAEE